MLDNIRNNSRSLGIKLVFGAIILVFVFWGMGNFSGGGASGVAEVNGEPITMKEYQEYFGPVFEAERQRMPELGRDEALFMDFKRQVLQQMIINRLWQQEAKKLGLFVSPYELRDSIARYGLFLDASGKFSKDKYLAELKNMGWNVGQFEEEQTRQLLAEKLQRYLTMGVGVTEAEARNYYDFSMEGRKAQYVLFDADAYLKDVQVKEEDIAAYYEARKESFRVPAMLDVSFITLTPDSFTADYPVAEEDIEAYYLAHPAEFTSPESYHVRHIFLALPENAAESEKAGLLRAAQERMAEFVEVLAAGESFEDLAIQYSDDEFSKMKGGDIGWVEKDRISLPEVSEALAALEPGQVSGVVSSEAGVHLFKLEERKPAALAPLDEVRDAISLNLSRERADAAFHGVQLAVEDALLKGATLESIAQTYGIEVQHTGLVLEQEALGKLGLLDEARAMLLDAVAGMAPVAQAPAAPSANATAPSQNATESLAAQDIPVSTPMVVPVPLSIKDGIAVVAANRSVPSQVRPLDDARAEISAVLEREGAALLAQNAATEALPAFTGNEVPEAYKDKVRDSEPFTRVMPVIPSLGESFTLAEALLSAADGNWLPTMYVTGRGAVIARVSDVESASAEEWALVKDEFMQRLMQRKSFETVAAFMQTCLANANIREMPGVLEQFRFR